MKILVSACLLGARCRYDGAAKPCPAVIALAERHTLVPVCPEQLGGLSTPRAPAERQGDRVCTHAGVDVTKQYRRGAEETLRMARLLGCECAVLKERSPSCGTGEIYDGRFSGRLISGNGVAAALLRENGLLIVGESQVDALPCD
ncbi:MAG: DUF523 domain-containing protein [Clostridia bacterium]|nr:DUF523 domain-containing protein [Clostridia bacterium]